MKTSRLPNLFRNVKREPNRFGYRSRFYDADKEEFDKRMKAIESEVETEANSGEKRISFRRNQDEDWIKKSRKQQVFNSNVVIMVVLIVLCFIAFAAIKYLETVHV